LVLRNVKFTNCPNAIQSVFNLENKRYTTGKIPMSSFSADSIPSKQRD
jgi:hypothetical protein